MSTVKKVALTLVLGGAFAIGAYALGVFDAETDESEYEINEKEESSQSKVEEVLDEEEEDEEEDEDVVGLGGEDQELASVDDSNHGHSHGGEDCHGHSETPSLPQDHGHSHGGEACGGHDEGQSGPQVEVPKTKDIFISAYSLILSELTTVASQLRYYEQEENAKVADGTVNSDELVTALRTELSSALQQIETKIYTQLGWTEPDVLEMQKKFAAEPELVKLIGQITKLFEAFGTVMELPVVREDLTPEVVLQIMTSMIESTISAMKDTIKLAMEKFNIQDNDTMKKMMNEPVGESNREALTFLQETYVKAVNDSKEEVHKEFNITNAELTAAIGAHQVKPEFVAPLQILLKKQQDEMVALGLPAQ